MKKLTFLFALMALMTSLAACNRSDESGIEREEDSAIERAGENMGEGMKDVGDDVEDATN